MTLALLFWLIMLLWLVNMLVYHYQGYTPAMPTLWYAGHILIFILLCLLGWSVFGPPLHG